jgi:hypothetical protein
MNSFYLPSLLIVKMGTVFSYAIEVRFGCYSAHGLSNIGLANYLATLLESASHHNLSRLLLLAHSLEPTDFCKF